MIVFWLCLAVGYFYMLLSVNFDVVRMVEEMTGPRFSQPWGRGKFGGWNALLYELNMLLYLVPPLAGVILARRGRYSSGQVVGVMMGFLFTLFRGFASGTRNLFGAYLLTFLVGYCFALPPDQKKRALTALGVGGGLMFWATRIMLRIRTEGVRGVFWSDESSGGSYLSSELFVDYNLRVISKLTELFPAQYDYLGLEIPYLGLVRPIPRAIWSGKPEGMSVGIEEALGAEGLTLSASFIGEAYMSGGIVGVVLIALFLGALARWWGQHASAYNSDLGILIYASGFFAVAITMRSMLVATTAMLPTIAAVVIGRYLIRRYRVQVAPSRHA
jgi:oligosaccharide repeat unit polymerase